MERIKEGRRDVLIHSDVTMDDLPVENLTELPGIIKSESFVPNGMDRPTLFLGDVIVGAKDGEIKYVELLYDRESDGVVVYELDTGRYERMTDGEFSKRFYADQIHVYSDVVDEIVGSDVTFDAEKLRMPTSGRV